MRKRVNDTSRPKWPTLYAYTTFSRKPKPTPANDPRIVQSWTILGSLAGVGFGFLENVVYAYSVGHFGLDVSLTLFLMRGLLTAPLHGITATLTGFGIGLWQKTGNPRLLILPMIVAMMIHGSFNLLASLV